MHVFSSLHKGSHKGGRAAEGRRLPPLLGLEIYIDMNKYKLLWVDGVPHDEMRWKLYPLEDWEHEIPKVTDYAVGRTTRIKKINNTLDSDILNGTKSPKSLDPSLKTSLND